MDNEYKHVHQENATLQQHDEEHQIEKLNKVMPSGSGYRKDGTAKSMLSVSLQIIIDSAHTHVSIEAS